MKKVLFILTIVQNTLIGRSKQSIGNATFTTWKGKNVLKSKPITVENPRTDGQVTQRLRMSAIVGLYRQISGAIQLGFKEQAVGKSEYNAFVSENIINGTSVTLPSTVTIVWSQILVAMGTIASTIMSAVVADKSSGNTTFTWSSAVLQPGQSLTDKLNVVIYNVTQNYFNIGIDIGDRADNTALLGDLVMNTGDTLEVYYFFTKADGSKSSDSEHIQVTVVA